MNTFNVMLTNNTDLDTKINKMSIREKIEQTEIESDKNAQDIDYFIEDLISEITSMRGKIVKLENVILKQRLELNKLNKACARKSRHIKRLRFALRNKISKVVEGIYSL